MAVGQLPAPTGLARARCADALQGRVPQDLARYPDPPALSSRAPPRVESRQVDPLRLRARASAPERISRSAGRRRRDAGRSELSREDRLTASAVLQAPVAP